MKPVSTKPKHGLKRSGARRVAFELLSIGDIAGIHPAVPEELYVDFVFHNQDLGWYTRAALDLVLKTLPVGVTPHDGSGRYLVISGFRTWQLCQSALLRSLVKLDLIPVVVFSETTDDQQIRELSIANTFLGAELQAFSQSHGAQQMYILQQQIRDPHWKELFCDRPRPSSPKRIAERAPQKTGSAEDQVKIKATGKRGRPRTRPLPDPNTPKRPRGRPPKNPPASSGDQGSQSE